MKKSVEKAANNKKSEERPFYELEVLTEREQIVRKLNEIFILACMH